MSRPTRVTILESALVHNVNQVKRLAQGRKIIAMVKANAYGCGLDVVVPVLESHVDAFGVACLEEAMAIRNMGCNKTCILFQGVFSKEELQVVIQHQFEMVVHCKEQMTWLLSEPLDKPVKIWIKINTGMNRLGFNQKEAHVAIQALTDCEWVHKELGLMTHLGYADTPEHVTNIKQLANFENIKGLASYLPKSIANSAAIMALPQSHADVVRPGIMLYGVSPFKGKTGVELGLKPVMQLTSCISAIQQYPPFSPVGYGGIWQSGRESIVGIVPIGYGDGYPRSVNKAKVWINGQFAPIVGRVSMDMLTVDLTHISDPKIGDQVELWGTNIPIEEVAESCDMIPYELLCTVTPRVRNSDTF